MESPLADVYCYSSAAPPYCDNQVDFSEDGRISPLLIGLIGTVYLSCDLERDATARSDLDRPIRTLLGRNPTEESEITVSVGRKERRDTNRAKPTSRAGSRVGDAMLRTALYGAANVLLSRVAL